MASFWSETLVASRLIEYEIWNRLHAYALAAAHEDAVHELLSRLDLYELSTVVLARAVEPFPEPVRTLDGLHLATLEYVRRRLGPVKFASYDERQRSCARKMGIEAIQL